MENFITFCMGTHDRVGEESPLQLMNHWVMMEIRQPLYESFYEDTARKMLSQFYQSVGITADPLKIEQRVQQILNLLHTPQKCPILYDRVKAYFIDPEREYPSQEIANLTCFTCGKGYLCRRGETLLHMCDHCGRRGHFLPMSTTWHKTQMMFLVDDLTGWYGKNGLYMDQFAPKLTQKSFRVYDRGPTSPPPMEN